MIYEDKYGVVFGGEYHSYRDFGLFPREKFIIAPPEPRTLTVEVPGMSGVLDYTESLTGDVVYNTRPATMRFTCIKPREQWDGTYHQLLHVIHGKRMSLRFDEDGRGYYMGRLSVAEPEYDGKRGVAYFTVEGDLDPYKYEDLRSDEPWMWDPFKFDGGVIRGYKNITVDGTLNQVLIGSDMPVVPDVILTSGSVSMTYVGDDGQKTIQLVSGSNLNRTPDLILRAGETTVTFTGNGVVTVAYRGGTL